MIFWGTQVGIASSEAFFARGTEIFGSICDGMWTCSITTISPSTVQIHGAKHMIHDCINNIPSEDGTPNYRSSRRFWAQMQTSRCVERHVRGQMSQKKESVGEKMKRRIVNTTKLVLHMLFPGVVPKPSWKVEVSNID